ncbi:MAG TPA: cellulose binding domain-containing protein [Rugosimonospora sp.]
MVKRIIGAVVTALALMLTLLAIARPAESAATPIRIMPLGDSITGSPGCWRALLWNRLQSAGYTNIDFVGTLPPQGCGVAYDGDNEGHGGILATNIVSQNQLPGWLSATHPDIVLMHLGTNDVWSNIAPATILAAFGTLVDQMRASNPNMKVLVAQILPMNPSNCAECAARVVAFDSQIPAWANAKSTAASPVIVVDQWTGFDDSTDTIDGVHPNDSGNLKMSNRWYPPLAALLTPSASQPPSSPSPSRSASPSPSASRSASPSPSVSPSPSRSASPTPTPTGGRACAASYAVVSQWQGGFQASVTVRNSGGVPMSAWTVGLGFTAGQTVTQTWNATTTQSGANVTMTNVSYNGSLAPGATTTAGFLANWTGSNPAPSLTCTPG